MNDQATSTPGTLLIVSGPSGAGKTTIARHIERTLGGVFSVSMTTRPKTAKDTEGIDYYFVDRAHFDRLRDRGELLEWAQVFDHCYGTPAGPVKDALSHGKLVILEIDTQGAIQVKSAMPDSYGVFIEPPSTDVLLERLRGRKRDAEDVIQRRFAQSTQEIQRAKTCGAYDAFVINDELDTAMEQALQLVRARLARRTTHA